METQNMDRDDIYGQFCDLEANLELTGNIVLSRNRWGYIVSQQSLDDMNKQSPLTSIVKLDNMVAKPRRYHQMDIYEEVSDCTINGDGGICDYLCVCIGAAIVGYLANLCTTHKT